MTYFINLVHKAFFNLNNTFLTCSATSIVVIKRTNIKMYVVF